MEIWKHIYFSLFQKILVIHRCFLIFTFAKYFFYLGFLSQPFTNYRIAGEGGEHLFNSSLPFLRISQTLKTLAGRLLQRAQLCTWVAAGLVPGTFGFRAQVANHWATRISWKRCKIFAKMTFLGRIFIIYPKKFL